MQRIAVLILLLGIGSTAQAQGPDFNPISYKGTQAGEPTHVLTLGSVHLGQLSKPFDRATLKPLLDKLAVFRPEIITHEGLSGEQCDILLRYKATYLDAFDAYCWGTDEARSATGLTVADAMAKSEQMLLGWPDKPTAVDRRKLALLFLAAGDRPSAQVQWLQLPQSERRMADGITTDIFKILDRENAKPNETYDIAVSLAVRLGLNRVYAVDDHTADAIQTIDAAGLEKALQRIWSDRPELLKAYDRASGDLGSGDRVLNFYRYINSPKMVRGVIQSDFGKALRDKTPELYGRRYVGWYETRNLRMVANIRAAFANRPGARVLNIVGSSHKGYYDDYLNTMHDVQLVSVAQVLK